MEKTTPKITLGESHCTAKDDYEEESNSVRLEDKKVKEETVGSIKCLEDFDLCIEIFSHWRHGTKPASRPKYLVIDQANCDTEEAWRERVRLLSWE